MRKRSGFQGCLRTRPGRRPACLSQDGLKTKGRMRIRDFGFAERLALVPIEVVPAVKWRVVRGSGAFRDFSSFLTGFRVEGRRLDLARPCLARRVGPRGCRPHACVAAVASRQGLFDKRVRPGHSFRPLRCARCRRAPYWRGCGPRWGRLHSGNGCVSGDELHRRVHIYVSFRRPKGDARCPADRDRGDGVGLALWVAAVVAGG